MIPVSPARRRPIAGFLCSLLVPATALAGPVADPTGFPFTNETLNYTVNWPTGLSLGEAHLSATKNRPSKDAGEQWAFNMTLDAAIPGFGVTDRYQATASVDLCSAMFDRDFTHGARKSHERVAFDQHEGVAHRETVGGGKSDVSISQCAHDALTFLYFARRELGQGRVPPHENILFGGPYQVRLEYTGEQTVKANDKPSTADRVIATLKGPASEITFEMFFARDAARTPLVIRVPLSLGMFSLELAR
ncbi:MAG: DUF3108 domain-containing protein [Acidobacteriia bacterium]|nr:DUF3108 domain-containing protein [Terriglobia bacterium]